MTGVMPDLPTRLARKWCPWGHKGDAGANPDHGCVCQYIAAAIHEALEEAEKVASLWSVKPDRSFHPDIPWEQMNETAQMVAHSTAQQIAAALAARREGQHDCPFEAAMRQQRNALQRRVETFEKAVTAYRDNFTAQTLVSRDGTKDVASVPRVVHDQLLTALHGEEAG